MADPSAAPPTITTSKFEPADMTALLAGFGRGRKRPFSLADRLFNGARFGVGLREAGVKLYRLLTGGDDAAFCKKVSEALNKGWELHGGPAVAFDSSRGAPICAQAVVKEVAGDWTDDMKSEGFKLSEQ